jgi:hypothetical protein
LLKYFPGTTNFCRKEGFKEAGKAWQALPASEKAAFAAKAAASQAAYRQDASRLLSDLTKQVSYVLFLRMQNIFYIG